MTKTNDFSNGLAGQLLKATAADESMQQNEAKDFSNGLIGQLVKATATNESVHLQPQEEKRTFKVEDPDYHGPLPLTDAELIFDGPVGQLGKLYQTMKSALKKAQAENSHSDDGEVLMEEMFPEFIENCDAWNRIADWNIINLSFDGATIKMYTRGRFTYPEAFIDNVQSHYPDIDVYYFMSDGFTDFCTNDWEGVYFKQRYFLHAEWVTSWDAPEYLNRYVKSREEAFEVLSNEGFGKVENEDDFLANNMSATQAILREINIEGQEPKNDSLAVVHGMAWRPCA